MLPWHIPGVFTEDATFQSPEEFGHRWKLAETKVLVNVGSVGQPRDGNNKACYVVLHPQGSPGATGQPASDSATPKAINPAGPVMRIFSSDNMCASPGCGTASGFELDLEELGVAQEVGPILAIHARQYSGLHDETH